MLVLSLSLNAFWVFQMTSGKRLVIKRDDLEQFRDIIDSYQELEKLSDYVEDHYYVPVDKSKLTEGMMKGLFTALEDPYSEFMDAETYARYEQNVTGEFPGIGIYFEPNELGQIKILSTIEDTPAHNAGLEPKDVIVSIDDMTFSADEFEVMVGHLKGEVGSKIKLKVFRPSLNKTFDLSVMRDFIDIKATIADKITPKTAYLKLISFDESSGDEVEKHLKQFKKEGVQNLILDLRQNPGGYLEAAIRISDMFLDNGTIVSTKSRSEGDEVYEAKMGKYTFEIAVLIDGGSASAAEILTAALKENKAATVFGENTFGKGLVQEFSSFTKERGFKLTTAQYFTPNGNYIQGVGIKPDVEIPSVAEENPTADNILEAAITFFSEAS